MSGFELFRVRGIPIRLDPSWLPVFALVLWSVSAGYLPSRQPDEWPAAYWLVGLAGALLFFASILLHELSHALVAERAGIRVAEIRLFLFGGVSRMESEACSPAVELRVTAAGPLASFALAVAFAALVGWLPGEAPGLVAVALEYLAWINAALGAFNLIPAFPLDGGRLLRATLWWRTGSLRRATRTASTLGRGFALVLVALGALELFSGAVLGGPWLILIGVFLFGVASAADAEATARSALEDAETESLPSAA